MLFVTAHRLARPLHFWDVAQRRFAFVRRRFWRAYRSHLEGRRSPISRVYQCKNKSWDFLTPEEGNESMFRNTGNQTGGLNCTAAEAWYLALPLSIIPMKLDCRSLSCRGVFRILFIYVRTLFFQQFFSQPFLGSGS